MKARYLSLIFVCWTGCITLKDDGKGTYRIGVSMPDDSKQTQKQAANEESDRQSDARQASVKDEASAADAVPVAVDEPKPDAIEAAPGIEAIEVPTSVETDEDGQKATVKFQHMSVSIIPVESKRDATLVFSKGGMMQAAVDLPGEDEYKSACDTVEVSAREVAPGLLAFQNSCFQEGGDNNYSSSRVVLVQYSGQPRESDDFEIRWIGDGDHWTSGYYADTHTSVKFVVRDGSVIWVETVRDGCDAGVRFESDPPEPCTPTTHTSESVLFEL